MFAMNIRVEISDKELCSLFERYDSFDAMPEGIQKRLKNSSKFRAAVVEHLLLERDALEVFSGALDLLGEDEPDEMDRIMGDGV